MLFGNQNIEVSKELQVQAVTYTNSLEKLIHIMASNAEDLLGSLITENLGLHSEKSMDVSGGF